MGQLYFITAYPRPFPEGQAPLMTRDLSHEEDGRSERGTFPVRRTEQTEQERTGRKKEEGERRLVMVMIIIRHDG